MTVTQAYLPTNRARIEDLIRQSDWIRSKKEVTPKIAAAASLPTLAAKPLHPMSGPAPFLPGLEHFAA